MGFCREFAAAEEITPGVAASRFQLVILVSLPFVSVLPFWNFFVVVLSKTLSQIESDSFRTKSDLVVKFSQNHCNRNAL